MIAGVNYPWTVFQGKPNYGCDFGANVWRCHAGVTAHFDQVRADISGMAALGAHVIRWFVFTDGRGGLAWTDDGQVAGLADRFFEDMDAALGLAADAGVRLCLVLFDFSWMRRTEIRDDAGRRLFVTQPEELATDAGRARMLARVLDPILDRYGTGGEHAALGRAIHSFDVINEPDWVTRELAWDRTRLPGSWTRLVRRPFSRAELQAIVRAVADRVHRRSSSLVTLGGGRITFASEWDSAPYGLDFVQIHSYPDARHPRRDRNIEGTPAAALGLSKPVLIGEFPAAAREVYAQLAATGGYLGAWPWSYKRVDDLGGL